MPRLNIQACARDYLAARLGVPVVVNVPDPRPASFVLVRRSGGRWPDWYRDRPGLDVEAWAPTEAEACDLMADVDELMMLMEYEHGVARVDQETLRSEEDPDSKSPRWYASYTITTYRIKEE